MNSLSRPHLQKSVWVLQRECENHRQIVKKINGRTEGRDRCRDLGDGFQASAGENCCPVDENSRPPQPTLDVRTYATTTERPAQALAALRPATFSSAARRSVCARAAASSHRRPPASSSDCARCSPRTRSVSAAVSRCASSYSRCVGAGGHLRAQRNAV